MQHSTPKAKYAMLDKYILVKTLGTGHNSKVKLALDPATKQYSAIKMIKYSHPALKPQYIVREVEILTTLSHPNVVGITAFYKAADYTKKNGETYKVVAIVMELLKGGELFEYIASSGRFSEEVSRLYFRIILETLHYCHKQGVTHRDLKLDNLLFDSGFNLKITDFGFATMLAGKEGDQLHTILGTESYMAPELHAEQSYSGEAVDLFACGIILFFMMNGRPPFSKANHKMDPMYKLIYLGKNDIFWENHEKNKQKKEGEGNFFSEDFRDLINSMLAYDPKNRLTLEQVKAHKWVQGPLADPNKLISEFTYRQKIAETRIAKQREAKKQQKLKANTQGHHAENVFTGIQPFRSLKSVDIETSERIEKELNGEINFETKREIGEYQNDAGFKACTEVLTVLDLDFVFKVLCLASKNKLAHYSVDDKAYKIKGKGVKDEGSCTLNIILTKVDEDTTCIEFHRTSGNIISFYGVIEDIKSYLPLLELEEDTNQADSEAKVQ